MKTVNIAIVVDEVLHAFHSHGNLHLIFGVASGETSSTGEDIHTPTAHLAIPESRITHISNLLKIALNQSNEENPIVENIDKTNTEICEQFGAPLFHIKSAI
jgi:hypothetical protein